jgi:hypothetical protein
MSEKYTLLIIGTAAICYGLICALRLKQSMKWTPVQGLIINSVKKTEHTDSGKLEYADIVYEYVFGEKKYTSKIIKIGGDLLSNPSKRTQTEADILLIKYPLGKEVHVYVNPKYPKVACLERAGAETIIISIFSGFVAVIAGLYFAEITNFLGSLLK